MATRIDYTKLFSEPRNNLVALIDNRTNIADPTASSTTEKRKMIYSRDPDVKSADFQGYPYIIIPPVAMEQLEEKRSVDGKSKVIIWIAEIEIITSDRGYGNKDGQGQSHLDSMSDDMAQTLNDKTNRNTLAANGMHFANLDVSAGMPEPQNQTLIYRRTFIASFKTKIQISA